jgi:hypothetical protein
MDKIFHVRSTKCLKNDYPVDIWVSLADVYFLLYVAQLCCEEHLFLGPALTRQATPHMFSNYRKFVYLLTKVLFRKGKVSSALLFKFSRTEDFLRFIFILKATHCRFIIQFREVLGAIGSKRCVNWRKNPGKAIFFGNCPYCKIMKINS